MGEAINGRAELVGFEYSHSIDGTGFPDSVLLEIDDGNECQELRYYPDTCNREALVDLADRLSVMLTLESYVNHPREYDVVSDIVKTIREAVGEER